MPSISTSTSASTSTSTSAAAAAARPSTSSNNAEIEEALARIRSHKGVEGILVMTKEGAIIQSTISEDQATTHAALLSQLTSRTSSVLKTLDLNGSGGDDELTFLRIRSKNKEIMIAPEDGFIMVVIQNPNAEK